MLNKEFKHRKLDLIVIYDLSSRKGIEGEKIGLFERICYGLKEMGVGMD